MLCRIADLVVEVPEVVGVTPHLVDYSLDDRCEPDIVLRQEDFNPQIYRNSSNMELVSYMETARLMYTELLNYDGVYLHSSAIEYKGRAYLFSGQSGAGKSTHTRLWMDSFGRENVKLFNDDKPALRRLNSRWYAYGTPWCGKDHININMKVPLGGICFLKQAPENKIRRLAYNEALASLMAQTVHRRLNASQINLVLSHLDKLIREIPIFELENRPEPEAAMLSYETMRKAAEEAGL